MKRMGYQPWVGLPNILCRDFVVPELLQQAASPEALARETLRWLDDRPRYEQTQARFLELHHMLKRDTARCATDAIAQVIEQT
jgi:lipid-A-disaccharide synthase